MKQNIAYLLKNAEGVGNLVDWLMHLQGFFGEEKTDAFCDAYIQSHEILRREDIRKLLPRYTLSVYWAMQKESIAFLSIYHSICRESEFVKKREDGFTKLQKFYREKDQRFAKEIRALGYSYEAIEANWKEKEKKDTYQRDYVFCIFSEKDTQEEFIKKICKLAQEFKQPTVLITEPLLEKGAKAKMDAKTYCTDSGKGLESYWDLTIPKLEKYLEKSAGTKVVFELPYERNKKVAKLEVPKIGNHYALEKQEKVKKASPTSFSMAMIKQALVQGFQAENKKN